MTPGGGETGELTGFEEVDFPSSLRDRVLARLGFSALPGTDLGGLRQLYAAWCVKVPFDNVQKMIALRTGRPLPGITATDFFETWLEHGTGGTCWSSSNALYTLFKSTGFDVARIAGSMRDVGTGPRKTPGHGSVVARIGGQDWLVDSSMLTGVPLPLGDEVYAGEDPVVIAEVERLEGGHRVWFSLPPHETHFPCWLPEGEATHALYGSRYEASRERSPFNQRLYARINRPGEMLVFSGPTRFSKTARGIMTRECGPDELVERLREEFGYSEAVLTAFVESGALADSLQPPTGPPPPAFTEVPPSMRGPSA
jgi:N-hydroxyarylamine O-acetyltransferase